MKILVTGSSGTIGTRLCEKLMEKKYEVVGVDRAPNKWRKAVDEITLRLDLRDEGQLSIIPNDIDLVVHLAANARVYELVEHPERALDNMITTFNTLEWARRQDVKKFIFASSREVYGNRPAEKFKEDMAAFENCESPYTASKLSGEALVESYKRCYGIDAIVYRFSNVYGAYDDSERVVPLFIRLARANKPLRIFGKQKNLDFTYIDDTVQGIMLGIEKFEEAKNDTYNIAYGEGTPILTLAKRTKELLGSNSEIALEESRTGEILYYVADITKAKQKLGFEPKTPFDVGIEKSVQWYMEHTSTNILHF